MLKSFVLIIFNLFRIGFGKLFHPGRFKVNWLQRISPRCALKVCGKGSLEIGRNCDFAPYCDLEVHGDGELRIGDNCYFNRFCMISAQESVSIGKGCLFGPGVKIFDNNHKHSPQAGVSPALSTAPVSIGEGSWLCSDVVVLKGVTIGKNCVIGAGCVVYQDVPDGTVMTVEQSVRTN